MAAILAAHPETDRDGLERLISGAYATDDESCDAAPVLYAFQTLCETFAAAKTTVEIYLDEDHFPAAWNLAYGAQDPPFRLPASNTGTPSAAYWPTADVPEQLALWKEAAAGSLYVTESAEISAVLSFAYRQGWGAYLFVTE